MKDLALLISPGKPFPEELSEFLHLREFEVDVVATLQEALQKMDTNQYSAVFVDLLSGKDAPQIKELRSRVGNAAKIFVTGPNEVPVAVQALQYGARHYWMNPLDVVELKHLYDDGMFRKGTSPPDYQREETLLQIIKEIALTMELEGLVNILMDSTMELTKADGGALLLLDDRSNTLILKSIRGISGNEGLTEFFGIPERRYYEILMKKEPVFLRNLDISIAVPSQERLKEAIIAPIWWKNEPISVLATVQFHGSEHSLSSDEFNVISLLVQEISGAVHNAITHYKTKELTIKDDLTEAYNRRYFEKYLEEEFMRARRYNSNLSLIFFDVDNLKEVNQKYGHLIGSKTLQEIAHRMILTVRGIDKVVRYGGDEFCIVLPETDTQGAYQVADRIRSTVAAKPFRVNDSIHVQLTGSMGIASFPAHASNKDELVRQADQAMFVIKNKSKNAIAVAEPLSK